MRKRALTVLACAAMAAPVGALARPADEAALPHIGPAPGFTLVSQSGRRVSLHDLRGRVTVVTFMFAGCSDTCPLLTSKLVGIQRRLGARVDDVRFAAITVDPLNDTPAVLQAYGRAHGIDPARFTFLTGSMQEIDAVTRAYAVFRKPVPGGGAIDHTFLTSLVDRQGVLRVQYIGVRFDPQEFLRDITTLVNERGPP
ncbi:MAG: SCO family protein [Burkholderiales bacterium]|jgi:protein SCO1/2|nr:SCO family protein [Burkholderiales bacterium]